MTRGGEPLSAAAVAVRLRRFWLGEAADEPVVRRSDLGDVWREITVVRVASTLTLYTPYDFGVGDPLEGTLGGYLTRRVRNLSEGAIREVAWDCDPVAAKPAARAGEDRRPRHLCPWRPRPRGVRRSPRPAPEGGDGGHPGRGT